jgi:hypothetical protein
MDQAIRLRWLRTMLVAGAIVVVGALTASGPSSASTQPGCTPWSMRTVASNLGILENLSFDGNGGMLLSAWSENAILRLTPSGSISPVVLGVKAPGGQRVRGHVLYFNTGDSPESGYLGIPDGTLQRFDLRTGQRATVATGLTMPNGLLFLPNGDAVVSRDLGTGTGITRIPSDDPAHPQANWIQTDDSNGMAIDPTKTWFYFVQTNHDGMPLWRAPLSDPSQAKLYANLGPGGGLDDMDIDRDGVLYIAVNRYPDSTGEVIRFDPQTRATCVIASGLQAPSSVKFGRGPGWPSNRLYVVGFDGRVLELTPPS